MSQQEMPSPPSPLVPRVVALHFRSYSQRLYVIPKCVQCAFITLPHTWHPLLAHTLISALSASLPCIGPTLTVAPMFWPFSAFPMPREHFPTAGFGPLLLRATVQRAHTLTELVVCSRTALYTAKLLFPGPSSRSIAT